MVVAFDIARYTIPQQGLARFIAACLLPGYVWLVLGGVLWMVNRGGFPAGPHYDAMLYTIFLGFVFSMIFGHAPVILPAIMRIPIKYSVSFYFNLGLLHLSLVFRIAGDLLFWPATRRWGGLLNEVAIILFLLVTISAAHRGMRIDHLKSS